MKKGKIGYIYYLNKSIKSDGRNGRMAAQYIVPSGEIKNPSGENYFPSGENKNTDGVLIAAKKKTGSSARSVLPESYFLSAYYGS